MPKKLFITISPPHRDNYKKFKNPDRFLYLEDKIQIETIMKYNKIKTYIIYPEFDVKGRLHYHGTVIVDHNQEIRFYKHAIHKLKSIGYVDVTTPKAFLNELQWIVYQSKEWGKTREILDIKHPIMYKNILLRKKPKKSALQMNKETHEFWMCGTIY